VHRQTALPTRKHLYRVHDAAIVSLDIPTGIPLVYRLDERLQPPRDYYLGDQAAPEATVRAVAAKGKARA